MKGRGGEEREIGREGGKEGGNFFKKWERFLIKK